MDLKEALTFVKKILDENKISSKTNIKKLSSHFMCNSNIVAAGSITINNKTLYIRICHNGQHDYVNMSEDQFMMGGKIAIEVFELHEVRLLAAISKFFDLELTFKVSPNMSSNRKVRSRY